MIKVVISDFGGVLTNPLVEAFEAYERISGIPMRTLGEAMVWVAEREGENPLNALEKGELSEHDFYQMMNEALGHLHDQEVSMHDFAEIYFDNLQPNEPFIDCLRDVKGRGYRLALLTNNVREWDHRWRSFLPIDELFETVVDSGFVGARKPERRVFEITLDYVRVLEGLDGVQPHECVLVDDIPHNCEAAREFGFHAILFDDTVRAIDELRGMTAGAPPAGR
jgi:putative hydrolase of the HAD superfamily